MAALRGVLYWKIEIFILLSVFPFLVVSGTDSPSTFAGNDIQDDHLTGHVQIRKDSVPAEVLPCITQPVLAAASACPYKHSQLNNMHCRNGSFGMYTDENSFVNFGAGPLGVAFPTLFFNPLVSYSGYSSDSSDSNQKTQRIEALLKENAKASMNVTLLGQMLQKLQREKEELKQELTNTKQTNAKQREEIHVLKLRAERWEEGHQECTASNVAQRNTSSIALRAAQKHIAQLKIENALFMEVNKECSSDLISVRKLLANVQNQSQEKELELASCSFSLTSIQESEAAIRKALLEEEEEHNKYISKCQEEHKLVISEKQDAQVANAVCEASLKDITNVHEQMKQDYDKCLEGVGRTNVHLELCKGALNLCRGNHSIVTNAGEMCEQDRELCLVEASRLKESLTVCEKNIKVSHASLNSIRRNEMDLTKRIVSMQSELKDVKFSEDELRNTVKTLTAKLDEERMTLSDADAKARTCSLDLMTARTSLATSRDRVGEVSEQLSELMERYTNLTKAKYRLETSLSVTMQRYVFLKSSYKQCRDKLNDETLSSERLLQTEEECQKQLSNVSTSLAVIELQRNRCLERHQVNVKQTDEWRERYEETNRQLTTSHLKHINCTGKFNLLNNQFNRLQEEADEMQTLNVNLNDRLKITIETMSVTTNSNTKLRETISIQQQERMELGKRVSKLEVTLEAAQKHKRDCLDKYDESKAQVVLLEENVSKWTSVSAKVHENFDQCSGELEKEQTALEAQRSLFAEQENHMRSVQHSLQVAKGLHSGVQAEAETLKRQLDQCHGNHTDSVSESLAWEQQLLECQKKMNNEIVDRLQTVGQVEERYEGCQSQLSNTRKSFNMTVLANKQCQSERKAETERAEGLYRDNEKRDIKIRRARRRLIANKEFIDTLQGEIKTWKARVDNIDRQNNNNRALLAGCREIREKKELELFEASVHLEECHRSATASASASAHAGTEQAWDCPKTEEGTYISSTSGCLLVTSSIGSQQEMETLCRQQAGGRLVMKAAASTRQMQADLTRVLAGRHLSSAAIWLDTPMGVASHSCYGLLLKSSGGHRTTQSRQCFERLPGLCAAGFQVDIVMEEVSTSFVNTSSSWSSSSSSSSNDASSDSINFSGVL